jgi:hypothetical protein
VRCGFAYTCEDADVAINYFPNKEPDAQEVIQWIVDEGRKILALPAISATRLIIWRAMLPALRRALVSRYAVGSKSRIILLRWTS